MTNPLVDQINLQQTSSHSYTSLWHHDWTIGPNLHGGHVAAVVQLAAQTHFATTLAAQNQPDILTLHLDFLVGCVHQTMQITVIDIKIGKVTSTIQLQVKQKDKLKAIATATSTNFSQPLGPTAKSDWALHPPTKPVPDFEKVIARKPEDNWIPSILAGEIGPFTGQLIALQPRGGFPVAGVLDSWYTYPGERIDSTYLTMMNDVMPSMSDTLLHNNGPFNGHVLFAASEAWAKENPGIPAPLTNSFREAAKATSIDMTLTLDVQYKRRLPKEGLEWVFSRIVARMLDGGRMDLNVTLCDRNMDVLCLANHTVLVVGDQRKYNGGKKGKL
ncbi:hypothetical protein V490_03667 [Pseudogymnoascus sp. VKM F-3557]|nr:hypothetical protein V490_03667 [Pseudogymnoascus sp. VKM F-3557]